MLLIGKILKETVKQGQLRRRRLSAEHFVKIREQQVTLKQIINDSKKSAFVRHYGIQANAQDFEFQFKNSVFIQLLATTATTGTSSPAGHPPARRGH